MPEHYSWFTYLMSLPGLQNLQRAFTRQFPYAWPALDAQNGREIPLEASALSIFSILVIILFALIARMRIARTETALVPEGKLTIASFMERFAEAFYGTLKDALGPKDAKYFLPIIGTCAVFIFFSNAIGLIPGFSPPTSNLNVTLACALIVFVLTHYYGLKRNGAVYLKHFLGPMPVLAPLLLPLELISHCVRPASLAIRLMVNMFVDHLLVTVFMTLIAFLVPVPVLILGVLVVTVQTYVFCLLATVYIQVAIEHHEEGEHGHEGAATGEAHDGHGHAAAAAHG